MRDCVGTWSKSPRDWERGEAVPESEKKKKAGRSINMRNNLKIFDEGIA
jgi:hypothetical protein